MLDRNRGQIWRWRVATLFGLAVLLAAGLIAPASAARPSAQLSTAPVVLYDGGLGTPPGQQGWFYSNGGAIETPAVDATTLDTTANKSISAGYFASAGHFLGSTAPVPVLDRTAGYTLSFTAQVQAEDHSGSDKNGDQVDDRAGFSVIVLGSDTQGIELGFWTDRIWAQEGGSAPKLFTQAEGAAFDTTARLAQYDLAVYGDSYQLSSSCTPIVSGKLRDYTAFSGPIDPYETPNFLFIGDDTTSASARMRLALVRVATATGAAPSLAACVYLPLVQ